mmetsp:Transcript_6132/g.18508  ORF Transcript_6132/g.18508 Transcript_6132/m.18508 type:complete len:293 (+) Transcript_6132:111-989(+)
MNWVECWLVLPGLPPSEAVLILLDILEKHATEGGALNFSSIEPLWHNWGTVAWGAGACLVIEGRRKPRDEAIVVGSEAPALRVRCRWTPCVGIVLALSRLYRGETWLIEYSDEQGPVSGFVGFAVYRDGVTLATSRASQWNRVPESLSRCAVCGATHVERCPSCRSVALCPDHPTHQDCLKLQRSRLEDRASSDWVPRRALLWSTQTSFLDARLWFLLLLGRRLHLAAALPRDAWFSRVLPFAVDFYLSPRRSMLPADIDQRLKCYADFSAAYSLDDGVSASDHLAYPSWNA